jgi:hypothetical protein
VPRAATANIFVLIILDTCPQAEELKRREEEVRRREDRADRADSDALARIAEREVCMLLLLRARTKPTRHKLNLDNERACADEGSLDS